MIGLLMGFGLPRLAAKLIAYVGVPLLIAGAIWLYGHTRYNAGYTQADTDQQARIAADRRAQTELERKADQGLRQEQTRDNAAAQQRQTEIDNATRNLPDQATSARQRTRACIELRRQAATNGRPQPAC